MNRVSLYGLKSCDSCRKARKWLSEHDVEFRYHDVRDDGLDEDRLRRWMNRVAWSTLVNKHSATWRKLTDADKTNLDAQRAVSLLVEYPTLLKRPVLESGRDVLVGFSAQTYVEAFSDQTER